MPRDVSAAARAALYAGQTGEVFVVLLDVEHPSFVAALRVCSDNRPTVSGGNTYEPFPFDITLPDENEEAPPRVTLRIDNVDRRVVSEIRRIVGAPARVIVRVVLASSPDTVEAGPFEFTLRDVSYDAQAVEGTLMFEDILNEPFPSDTFTPSRFPSLF